VSKPPSEIVIAEFEKNARETIRVALDFYEGQPTFLIWRWYRSPTGERRPGKGGLVIGLRHLPALAKAVEAALTTARELGRLPSE
jgi:hypothetical protein